MREVYLEAISNMKIFKNIAKSSIDDLADICEIKCYQKGRHIFRDKEVIKKIFIVSKGKVSLYKLNESAQKKIIFILGEEDIINAVVLDDLPASINCEAFENVEILAFDKEKFQEVMAKDFELTKIIMSSLTIKVRRLYRQLKNSTPIKVEKRVAAKLWKLSKDYGVKIEDGVLIDLKISITYLADMFGASRETISRALKILQENELIIIDRKKIIVKDRDKLSNYFKGL
ncbi:Crp/Fnr family transcriptional regulator [Clostridium sartagoforme]|uniref:Crp/Fnr family transcriptional regulator n=1 Tax=Clostridium sartagoforme TaxID=84031 RepID=A0A4S2DNK5_9CLOT|nr:MULTISPECIES: Crp/Fnr family transcriptional regulator [Clostridium]MBS5937258.1 Crp/Fnr family transcriptional regulator [Clostridium sp.]TGY43685.1 Crp/Fnr family transcriptional regulator [Clostridium sartagoforme]